MMRIIKEEHQHLRKPRIYLCHHCKSVFETDEIQEVRKEQYPYCTTRYVRCPVCTIMIETCKDGRPYYQRNVWEDEE